MNIPQEFYAIELDCGAPFPGCVVLGPFPSRPDALAACAAANLGDYVITVSS